VERAAELIEPNHPSLSMRTQCKLLGIARSSLDYVPVAEVPENTRLRRILDETYPDLANWESKTAVFEFF
jgi:hypothetical protein